MAQCGLESSQKSIDNVELAEMMETIIQNADAINDILVNFLHFAKPSSYQMQKGSIPDLLEQGLKLMQYKIKKQKISVVKELDHDLPKIVMDEKLLLQACLNLLNNAVESMSDGGWLVVKALYQTDTIPQKVLIIIEDTGRGIHKDLLSSIFHPFFTTKNNGIGLGLPIAERIIHLHNGQLRFASQTPQGTKAMIEFPVTT